jgi:hypothetical protein
MTAKSGGKQVVKIRQLNVERKIIQCRSSQFIPESLPIDIALNHLSHYNIFIFTSISNDECTFSYILQYMLFQYY